VQPSRAQEILYGPTLQSYLLGEQISGALLAAAKLTPQLILIDQPAMLLVRPQSSVPLVLVQARSRLNEGVATQKSNCEAGFASNAAGELATSPSGVRFTIGVYDVELPSGLEARRPAIEDLLNLLAQHVDLAEPFGRIHEAIREAQRIGGRSDDAHGQAA
jgi:hypothetical protein